MIQDESGLKLTDITSSYKAPIEKLVIDIIDSVNARLLHFYCHEEPYSEIKPIEALIMVTANIFSNTAIRMISTSDLRMKLKAFNFINDELHKLNNKLFMALEAANADEKCKN